MDYYSLRQRMRTSQINEAVKANVKQTRVLVIEDNEDHWSLMNRAMQQCLSEVTPILATTTIDALDIVQKYSIQEWELPKLILLDLYLPTRADGWEFLQQIKSLPPPCNQIPVVVLSASNDPADISESYQHGGSSYIVKPTDFSGWITYFNELRIYWWETVTLPPTNFSI